jgi:hypothetical protein
MSLADNKRSIFTTIGSYSSLMQEGKPKLQTDLYSSINNKDDIIPFLLDVLKTVAGTEALKEVIGKMFSDLIDEVEPQLKTVLKKQFIQSNASDLLPTTPIDFKNNGITISVKSIDVNGKLKIDPSSVNGNLIYGELINSFDIVAYNAIQDAGTFKSYNNMAIKYVALTDSFQIKPTGSTTNIGDYFSTFIDNTELINKKELMSSVMNNFYGTLTKQNKTVNQVNEELQTETLLQQVLDNNDSFVILPNKNDELLVKARELVEGIVNYNLGCGLMPAELSFENFNSLISTISGSTDPFFIGNQIGLTIDQSTSATENTTIENKQTIKDNFFQKIIKIFTVKMLEAVSITPQIRVLFGMMNSLQNNGIINLNKPSEDMKNFRVCIKCMAKAIMKSIAAFIFALTITYIIKLLKPVIKKVVKEKTNQYVGIIKSLTGANKLIT